MYGLGVLKTVVLRYFHRIGSETECLIMMFMKPPTKIVKFMVRRLKWCYIENVSYLFNILLYIYL